MAGAAPIPVGGQGATVCSQISLRCPVDETGRLESGPHVLAVRRDVAEKFCSDI